MFVDGSIEAGIFAEIGISYVHSKLASFSYRFEAGKGLEGNTMLFHHDANEALHSTTLYQQLRECNINLKGFVSGGLPVKLLWLRWLNNRKQYWEDRLTLNLVPAFADTWGETREKSYYSWDTYKYYDSNIGERIHIGDNISGTGYDVARVRWSAP